MRIRSLISALGGAALTLAAPALAQDAGSADAEADGKAVELVLAEPVPANILIVATRSDDEITTESYIGSSTVLTPLQIEQRQVRDVADVLVVPAHRPRSGCAVRKPTTS